MVVVHSPTLDFSSRREQAQGLSQFVEVKEFRFAMRRNLIGQVSMLRHRDIRNLSFRAVKIASFQRVFPGG
jgi:hypothetical protein